MSFLVLNSTRVRKEGSFDLRNWSWEDRLERMVAKKIWEHIEADLTSEGMSFWVHYTANDVVVKFSLGEHFGKGGTIGPTWKCSIRKAVQDSFNDKDLDAEEFEGLASALRKLADHVEKLGKKMQNEASP